MSLNGNLKRWMYHGQRPNWLASSINKMWAIVDTTGMASNMMMSTLEVVGRKSGRTISLPVVIAIVDGQHYLVSMLGEEVQWVCNVRAGNGRATLVSGGRQEVRLEDMALGQRAPILKEYLQRAPDARPHIDVSKDAPLSEFEAVVANYPVFRIVPSATCHDNYVSWNGSIKGMRSPNALSV